MIALLLAACGAPEEPGAVESADTGAEPAEPTGPEICLDAPVTTWDNFGAGFVTQHCSACHASTTPDRHDAPADVTFDTEEQAWQWAERILARAASETPTMPPQGGVSEDDRYLLEVWLNCGG